MYDGTTISQLSQEINGAKDPLQERLVSGYGGYHTANPKSENPKPYTTISLEEIVELAKSPGSVPKDQAQWIIPSTTGGEYARVHDFQRENGQFIALWADIDKVEESDFQDVVKSVRTAINGSNAIIYNSKSATKDNPKSRVIVPLLNVIPGRDYHTIAKILNDRLDAAGLPPDRATERPGQLCYLPNRGEYYDYEIIKGPFLDPKGTFAYEIAVEEDRLKAEAEKRKQRHQEALRKTQERIDTGMQDPVEAFKLVYPVETALDRYGYQQKGKKWISPRSESGNPGVSVKDGKWFSHHTSDSGIGQPHSSGGCWGDAFDFFVHFECGGDFNRAVKEAGEMFTVVDKVTGETITINKFNQREYMRGQDNAINDFKAGHDESEQWEPIIRLDHADPPSIDPVSLPGIIGDMTRAIAGETETPVELPAGLIFAAIATVVQGKIILQVKPNYHEPLSYWAWVGMDPATRKSQVLKIVTKPMMDWEQKRYAELEPLIKEAKSIRANQEARLKSLRGKYAKANSEEREKIESEILELELNLQLIPEIPQLWAQDITPEHTGTIMSHNDGRLGVFAAEGGILDTLAGRYSGGVANLDLYLQGYSGDPVKVDRGNREPIYLPEPSLSMGLAPQPGVFKGLKDKPVFRSKGFSGRPTYFLPSSNLGSRRLDTDPIPGPVKTEYQQMINSLIDIQSEKDVDSSLNPYIIKLSKEAYREWSDFWHAVEKDLKTGGRFEHIRDWAGKLPGRAARLAGLFHCALNPSEPWELSVDKNTMINALDISATSCEHAIAAFGLMGADDALDGAAKILSWIKKNGEETFKKKKCFDSLRGTFPRVANLKEPLNVLVERNYIKEIDPSSDGPGRKPFVYSVNPAVWEA